MQLDQTCEQMRSPNEKQRTNGNGDHPVPAIDLKLKETEARGQRAKVPSPETNRTIHSGE